jgi:hypothetical protein
VEKRGHFDKGMSRYGLADFNALHDAVEKTSENGSTVPLAGDQFRVIRFDLMGSNQAIRSAGNGRDSKVSPVGRGTRIRRSRRHFRRR